eukprot:4751991-Prymnesium_polylepis.2
MRRAVLLAAAHGMTDFAAPSLLLPYGVIAMPLPGWLTTTAFGAASVVHFAADVGLGERRSCAALRSCRYAVCACARARARRSAARAAECAPPTHRAERGDAPGAHRRRVP